MDDHDNISGGGAILMNTDASEISLNRREVVAGLAVGAVAVTSTAQAQQIPTPPDVRFVRNPSKHNEIGIAVDLSPSEFVADNIAIVFYPRMFGGIALPKGQRNGQQAFRSLDRFIFEDMTFSDRHKYTLEFNVKAAGDKWTISGNFNRDDQKPVASNFVEITAFARGSVGLNFTLSVLQAELLRWDLFGERLEIKGGDGVQLTLTLVLPAECDPKSPWIEPDFILTLKPINERTKIWTLNGAAIVNSLTIRRADGDQGDGARFQEEQELLQPREKKNGSKTFEYRSKAWIGEASDLSWASDKKTAEGLRRYQIGKIDAPREKPALQIVQNAQAGRITLRQWGKARNTLVLLRAPIDVTVLSPTKAKIEALPPADFPLADAILTRQDRFDEDKENRRAARPGDNKDEVIEETLTGRLNDKPFSIDTVYGAFIVEGDPAPPRAQPEHPAAAKSKAATCELAPIDKKSGGQLKAVVPTRSKEDAPTLPKHPLGRRLDRREDFAARPAKGLTQFHMRAFRNEIRSFDVRALLRQISVALPNARLRDPDELPMLSEEASVWSRLDFDGTEIMFRLHLPNPPADQTWPSTRGFVTLGEEPRELPPLTRLPVAQQDAVGRPLSPGPVSIALDGAHLKARRDSDNFALSFQFARMALQLGKGKGRIVPNMLHSGGGSGKASPVGKIRRSFDDRPLLIVHFPPQHVAERVYYRQANDGVSLPDVPSSILKDKQFADDLDAWRREANTEEKRKKRVKLFEKEKAIIKALRPVENNNNRLVNQKYYAILDQLNQSRIFELFDLLDPAVPEKKPEVWLKPGDPVQNRLLELWSSLKEQDQRNFYLGTSARAIDPDVRKVWLEIWRAYVKQFPAARPNDIQQAARSEFEEVLLQLPDTSVPQSVQDDIILRLPDSNESGAAVSQKRTKKYDPIRFQAALAVEKAKRSDDFRNIAKTYSEYPKSNAGRANPRPSTLLTFYSGAEEIRNVWKKADAASGEQQKITAFLRVIVEEYRKDYPEDDFLPVTPARLSGPSRLVFRFDSAGGTFDDKDREKRSELGEEKEAVRSIDFSFEGLTDWGRFDLAVTRRAETLEILPGGRVPHPDMRAIDLDSARILAHQGIRPGRSIQGRLSDIRESLHAPAGDETAIELPFRLILSPDQFGRFRTRRPIAQGVLREVLQNEPPTPPVLWSAHLQLGETSPVVRAIWSDDFRPAVFGGGGITPTRGPQAPWEVARKSAADASQFRTPLDACDRHEIVALSSVYGLPVMGRRDELDNLVDASQYEPPKSYQLDGLKVYPLHGAGKTKEVDLSGIYNPASLDVTELRLTALGGSLRHDSAFTPPAPAVLDGERFRDAKPIFDALSIERWRQITVLGRDIEVEVVYKGFLFPLGVRAALVKLTERRFLRHGPNGPFTAYLIQRKFIRIGKPTKKFPAVGQPDGARRFPVSELVMLTKETPDIVNPDLIVTHLALAPLAPELHYGIRPNGKIDFSEVSQFNIDTIQSGLCFWPRTRPGRAGNILFEFRIEGSATPLRMPLIFVDNVAANNPATIKALATYYNRDSKDGFLWNDDGKLPPEDDALTQDNRPLRTLTMGSARRRYADENQDGECHFETFTWEIKAEGRTDAEKKTGAGTPGADVPPPNTYYEFDSLLQGSDQPPFYPYISCASIRIGQAERFVGRSLAPREVEFDDTYRLGGFPSAADAAVAEQNDEAKYPPGLLERYLKLRKKLPLDMGEGGDRSGGIGRPAMDLKYLSRRYGLMPAGDLDLKRNPGAPAHHAAADLDDAGEPVDPPPPPFNLESFFNGDAKLLGILTFQDLIKLATGSAAPALKEKVDSATEETAEFLRQSVLPEIERALKSLEAMWEAARKALSDQTTEQLEINKIYPDIAPALIGLIDKVKRARTASNLELVGAMSQVQAGGRKLVTAISRTLADPITPLREELRAKFRVLSQQIEGYAQALKALNRASIETLIGALKTRLAQAIKAAIADQLATIKPFTRLLLSLPIPDDIPILSADDSKRQFSEQLDTALALGAIEFVTQVAANGLAREKINEALTKGLEKATTSLDEVDLISLTPEAADAISKYRAQAQSLLDDLNDKKVGAEKRLLEQVPGALYPFLFGESNAIQELGKVRQLEKVVEEFKVEIGAGGGREAIPIIARHIGKTLKVIADALIEQEIKNLQGAADAKFASLCGYLAEKTARIADSLLPRADNIGAPAGSTTDLAALLNALDNLTAALSLTLEPSAEVHAAIARYTSIRKQLTAGKIVDFCEPDKTKSALSTMVVNELRELNTLRSAIAGYVRTVIEKCVEALESASEPDRANAAKHIESVVAQLVGFVGLATKTAGEALQTLQAAIPKSPEPSSAINRAVADQLEQISASIGQIGATLDTISKMLAYVKVNASSSGAVVLEAMRMLVVVIKGAGTATDDQFEDSRKRLENELVAQAKSAANAANTASARAVAEAVEKAVNSGIFDAIRDTENRLIGLLGRAMAAGEAVKEETIKAVGRIATPIFETIRVQLYEPVDGLRKRGREALDQGTKPGTFEAILKALLKSLKGPNGQSLATPFSLLPIDADGNDQLTREIALLKRLEGPVDPKTFVADFATLTEGWRRGDAAPLALLNNLFSVLTAVLRGDLAQFVDLHQIRREIDAAIRTMVPARIRRSYDLKLRLGNIGKLIQFDKPSRPHPNGLPQTLVIRATGVVDVLQPKNSSFEAAGFLPGFALQLLPAFDVVTFSFPPTTFTGGAGRPFAISLKVDNVELGSKVQFLKKIESILPAPKNGKGFFIRMLSGRAGLGIVAGYMLPISPITIGNMFIDNLSLNAAAELPFDNGDARFVISVSRPEAPFMIAAAPYAGAGHFGLIANPKGIIGFEASFQFGGGGGFSFGPLTGKGRISVGIYIRKISGFTELYGLFYAGGSARIACFAVGAQLNVRMSQQGSNVEGEAIFTFSFSIGIKDIEYSVTVFKREQGSGGSGGRQASVTQDKNIDLAASEFRDITGMQTAWASLQDRPLLINATRCKADDFGIYRSYFSHPGAAGRTPARSARGNKYQGNAKSRAQVKQAEPSIWIMP